MTQAGERRESLQAYLRSIEHNDLTRRNFVKLLGASIALAGIEGCTRMPTERILPYAHQPDFAPGVPERYATAMTIDGYATGLLVESYDGRPIKIEGNPDHPASLGAAGIHHQASVLELYDPRRAHRLRFARAWSDWSEFARMVAPEALRPRVGANGERLRILLEPTASPLMAQMIERLSRTYPAARVHFYAPLASPPGSEPFGSLVPHYDLRSANVILTVDSDVLAEGPFHLRHARHFGERRRPENPAGMNRLYAVESSLSVTGANADHRLALRPSDVEPFLHRLMTALTSGSHDRSAGTATVEQRFAAVVAHDLSTQRGRSLVIGGTRLGARAQALIHAINESLGNFGNTVWLAPSPLLHAGDPQYSLAPLLDDLRDARVDTLLCIGGNPAFAGAHGRELADLLERVPQSIYLGMFENETAHCCTWLLPQAHYLESWGDTRAYDGTLSVVQPLIAPLFGGKSDVEVLAMMTGNANASAYDLLLSGWRANGGDRDWQQILRRGLVAESAFARAAAPSLASAVLPSAVAGTSALEAIIAPDARVLDGRFANNAWLQELPDPITTLTWGNAAHVSPATSARLGVGTGDVVRITSRAAAVELPVVIVPGHADECLTVHAGYGRRSPDTLSDQVGTDVFPLLPADGGFVADVTVEVTAGKVALALTQHHWSLEAKTPAHTMTAAQVRAARPKPESRPLSLYQLHNDLPDGPAREQWAMTIDLSACIGCGACVLACQAENNIPVVGVEGVRAGREMHWLRIDRYIAAATDPTGMPQLISQPMLCQHCEKAPCEYVCPVEATVHSPDGLNEMVYNRCVGTRFCSNNCPYKVRRFNWFDYNALLTESEELGKNPNVSVRERGVIEKCTFCVQRIRSAQINAEAEGRPLRTDEVVTACQQACPTHAIVFGSLTDPASAVHDGRAGPRAYSALEELGTVPRVRYLARMRNPSPLLESAS